MSASVHLIFGQDSYQVDAKVKALIDEHVPPEQQAFGLDCIDGRAGVIDEALAALARCRESLNTVGFLGAAKVTWLKDASFLGEDVQGRSEQVKERVNALADAIKAGLPDGVCLVVTAPQVSKRSAFYKACDKVGVVQEFAVSEKAWEVEKTSRQQLAEGLKRIGLRMSRDTTDAFLAKAGSDTRQIVNELEKLSLYLGKDRRDVQPADVAALTCASREAAAWDLVDAFGERRLASALTATRRLLFQKESPIGLVLALGRRVRDLMLYREALDRGWLRLRDAGRGVHPEWGNLAPEIDSAFGSLSKDPREAHPFYAGKLAAQARRFSLAELRTCSRLIQDTHSRLVSSRLPEAVTLELMLIRALR
jgi:DNA polymerase-3 subunit delta